MIDKVSTQTQGAGPTVNFAQYFLVGGGGSIKNRPNGERSPWAQSVRKLRSLPDALPALSPLFQILFHRI